MNYSYSLHGHAVALSSSPEQCSPADCVCFSPPRMGAGWQDPETLHVWGTAFAGGQNRFEWYYIFCPAPGAVAGRPLAISRFEILVDIKGEAYMDRVQVEDHTRVIFTEADLQGVTNYEKWFASPVPVSGSCSIYLRVLFQGPATVNFHGTNIAVVDTVDARVLTLG